MSQRYLIGAVVIFVLLAGAGYFAYDAVLGETVAPSAPISAPTLALAAATPVSPAVTAAVSEPTAQPTSAPAEIMPVPSPTAVQGSGEAAVLPQTGSLRVYNIVSSESEVSFNIYELLRGEPKDVIGTTDQVAGQVAVDPNELSTAQIGEIRINARDLATDDDRRNNAIRNRILFTDRYEYITFKPTAIEGLSGSGALGQPYTFRVTGDMTIKDITRPVVFDVTLTAESEERLVGVAQGTIQRSDFDLTVPSVPFVANVGESVALEIRFVLAP
jgi:polyisoprenoid-binding protein YceI